MYEGGSHRIASDVYETVCSFSNHFGGTILCGILDDGSILRPAVYPVEWREALPQAMSVSEPRNKTSTATNVLGGSRLISSKAFKTILHFA